QGRGIGRASVCEVREKTEHTPGPWNVCEPVGWMEGDRTWTAEQMAQMWWVGKRPGVAVALIDGSAEGRVEAEANARLIAQAPDLLGLCIGILECLDAGDQWTAAVQKRTADTLRAAIAKAKGPS